MTWVIARYTFETIVRSKSFIVAVFGLPALCMLWLLVSAVFGALVVGSLRAKLEAPIGIWDQSGVFADNPKLLGGLRIGESRTLKVPVYEKLKEQERKLREQLAESPRWNLLRDEDEEDSFLENVTVLRVEDLEAGKRLLLAGEIEMFIHFPENFEENGKYSMLATPNRSAADLSSRVMTIAKDELLARGGFNFALRQGLLFGLDGSLEELVKGEFKESPEGLDSILLYQILLVVALVLPMGAAASYGLSSSLSDEAESKLQEVFLSSVSVRELMLGKVLGSSGADLLTVIVWSSLVLSLAAMGLGLHEDTILLLENPWILVALVFAAIGLVQFHLIGAFLGSVFGSSGRNKLVHWISRMISLVPIAGIIFAIFNPDGRGIVLSSYIPPLSAAVTCARLVLSEVGEGHLVAIFTLNIAFLGALSQLCARLYRTVLLMSGKRYTLSEFVSNFRLAV